MSLVNLLIFKKILEKYYIFGKFTMLYWPPMTVNLLAMAAVADYCPQLTCSLSISAFQSTLVVVNRRMGNI